MKKLKKQLVLLKEDYTFLLSYLNSGAGKLAFDRKNAETLQDEIKKAKVVSKDDFPSEVVRLNSTVRIRSEEKGEEMELMVVTPDKADIKSKKISVMAPIGTALIGFSKGQQVKWQVPAGSRTFTILDVINE